MPPDLKRTPLYAEHLARGARMTAFAGWEMPLQYTGIIAEHRAVRSRAGLFDVSHLGRIEVRGRSALPLLQRIAVSDLSRLAPGRLRYTLLCREDGGILDDIMVYCLRSEEYLVTCNAINIEKVLAWLGKWQVTFTSAEIQDLSPKLAMLALQGSRSSSLLESLGTPCHSLARYGCLRTYLLGREVILSRTGFTGEDGFEITLEPGPAIAVWQRLMGLGVTPCGLGARDTLRLEAGFPLYGQDMDETVNPYEIEMAQLVHLGKGDFIGKECLTALSQKNPSRQLVGLELVGRGVARAGHSLYQKGKLVGKVTSGTYAPSLDRNIALAMVAKESADLGNLLEVDIRGNRVEARVVPLPFYRHQHPGL